MKKKNYKICISCKKKCLIKYGAYIELKNHEMVICADCCRYKLGLL